MTRIALISSANRHRIRQAEAWLESRAPAEEVVIVGATRDAANDLARKVAKKKGAAFGWHRLTLPQLAYAIAEPVMAARGLIPITRIGADALATRLVHRMNAEGQLGHYQSIAETPGFPRAVARVITELRLARLPPEAIARSAPDLAPLVDAFEVELEELGLADWPSILALASEVASAVGGNRPRVIGLPMLLLDVTIGSEAELVFVHSLAAAVTEILATAPAADQSTLGRLRDRLRMEIEDLDRETVGGESDVSWTDASALANLQRRLFKEEEGSIAGKPDDTVEVFSAPGEGRECIEIARRVLSHARLGIPLIESPCCCGLRMGIAPTFRRLSTERAFQLITHEAPCGPILRDARSVRCSSVRPRASQREDSRSTFRLDGFRM